MLIRQMSLDNPLWGAPRIHGELLKLGFQARTGPKRTHGQDPRSDDPANYTGPLRR